MSSGNDFRPGDMAVDWDNRVIYTRSYEANYWYDTRYTGIGRILHSDADMAASGLDFYRQHPTGLQMVPMKASGITA